MSRSRNVRSLVEAARDGDAAAFGELHRMYYPLVHGIVLARVPYRDVDDIVQEVFTIAWRKLNKLRRLRAFRSWLAKIARYRCARYIARRGDAPVSDLPDDLSAESPEVVDALGLLGAMRELADDYREILVLRFVEGLTGPEIAELLGMTHGSVRVKIHRGLKMLRSKIH